MKNPLPAQATTALCPLLMSNTSYPPAQLPARPPLTPGTPAVLNGQLLGTRHAHGIGSHPSPAPAPLDFPLGVEALPSVTEAARRAANRAALAQLTRPNPDPRVLAAYSGGGGIGESINEFYTPRDVARAMWAASGKLPDGARVLDPACGVGSLLALAPQGSLVVGVELERDSARIAQALLPAAHIHHSPFEAYSRASTDTLFDLAILNPPFGPRSARELDAPHLSTNERYFLETALARVKHQDGVMVALVNASLVVGQTHRGLRLALAKRARLIHAVLVPEGAFNAAGAGVTTAILTFRRHDVGVAEALGTLTEEEALKVLSEYDRDHWAGGWVDGTRLIERKEQDGLPVYTLRTPWEDATRLSRERTLTTGRSLQPCSPGEVDASASRLERIRAAAQEGLKGPGVTLPNVLEQIRVHVGEDTCQRAREAAREASALPIPPGTRSPDGAWLMTPSGWAPTDDLASPPIADALRVAVSLSATLSAKDPLARQAAQRHTLALDRAYRHRHGPYDAARLARLAGKFPTLGLLTGHLQAGTLTLPERPTEVLTGTPEAVAPRLAELLILDEHSLSAHSGLSEQQALAFLAAHYAFTGERWVSRDAYFSGNAYRASDAAREAAKAHSGLKRSMLLRQADELLAKITPLTLADLTLSPRDPIIPLAALEAWLNTFLASTTVVRGEELRLLSVTREGGAVKLRLRAGQGDDNLRARRAIDPGAARALQNFLNHRTDVGAVWG